jgi:GH15 family glucan-1,4-alpha-glucosidase
MHTLDLGVVGNSGFGALIAPNADVVWSCLPRPDGEPVFCDLLRPARAREDIGFYAVELEGLARTEQEYLENTAILLTRLYDARGGAVEVADFAPRFRQFGRVFRPVMLVRQLRPLAGAPRVRVRLRPAYAWGGRRPEITFGSNHLRYVGPAFTLRLTTDASITAIADEMPFVLDHPVTLVLGPDETVQENVHDLGRRFFDETRSYWREWVRYLGVPFDWQEAVIRAAITLKLNAFDDTGAIVAAMTTSIPEAPASARNWDYRYCWLRDAYFVVAALNRLSATDTMERYLRYVINIVAANGGERLRPVYRINGDARLAEHVVPTLAGYRGMGPVRAGNQAVEQVQNDVYGSAVLAATHLFFDRRIVWPDLPALFRRLEPLGETAARLYDQPDAGLWELRGAARVHTFSGVMCWVACDRLARIALRLGLAERAARWREQADAIRARILAAAWSERCKSFTSTFGGEELDASLLLLAELGFVRADDPRFAATVEAIGRRLRKGEFIFRYVEPDDFGAPENAFLVCTFWYADALAALGRREQARELFERLLACRNRHGIFAEHISPATRELWGNYPQTYSMVGLINSAMRLSRPWEGAY